MRDLAESRAVREIGQTFSAEVAVLMYSPVSIVSEVTEMADRPTVTCNGRASDAPAKGQMQADGAHIGRAALLPFTHSGDCHSVEKRSWYRKR